MKKRGWIDWLRRILARAAFLLAVLGPALAVTELFVWKFKGAGAARRDIVAAGYMPTRLRANYRGTVMELPFVTNRYGFRGEPDFSERPTDGKVRLMALGDSVGIGLGVEASDHYVKVAERRLNEPGLERFRIINAAGQGYSPSSYYAYLTHEGLQLEPKMVILEIELCNDVTDEALLTWGDQEGDDSAPESVRGGRYVVAWDGNLLGTVSRGPFFYERTYTYTLLLRRVLNKAWETFPRGPFAGSTGVTYFHLGFDRFLLTEERIEQGWQRLFGALDATHRLLRKQAIPFVLLILPSRYLFDENESRQKIFAGRLVERAAQMASDRGIPYLEVTEELAEAGGAALYLDFAHPSKQGNRVIGRKLGDYLIRFTDRLLPEPAEGQRASSPGPNR